MTLGQQTTWAYSTTLHSVQRRYVNLNYKLHHSHNNLWTPILWKIDNKLFLSWFFPHREPDRQWKTHGVSVSMLSLSIPVSLLSQPRVNESNKAVKTHTLRITLTNTMHKLQCYNRWWRLTGLERQNFVLSLEKLSSASSICPRHVLKLYFGLVLMRVMMELVVIIVSLQWLSTKVIYLLTLCYWYKLV